ncbi:MAG: hypothetical protein HN856_09535 [Gammaproteobacteria bacterium]|nr:hypothetical protein [Gammaproteobacteria bacterium]
MNEPLNPHPTAKARNIAMALSWAGLLTACTSTPIKPEGLPPAPQESRPPASAANHGVPKPTNSPHSATEILLARAQETKQQGDVLATISHLERAVRIDPRNPRLWIALSQAHLSNRDLSAANQYVRKAIALSHGNLAQSSQAWLQLANVREAQGKASEAASIRAKYQSTPG